MTPGNFRSTGSSMVTTLMAGLATLSRVAYSVVDFPDPVGPVATIIP